MGFWIQRGSVRRWVEAVNAEKPDLVVITGDLTDSARRDQVVPHLPALGGLRSEHGTFAVWGNHDYRFNGYGSRDLSELEGYLNHAGVQLLVNSGVKLRDDFYLAGVDDLWHGRPDAQAATAAWDGTAALLLLCHNPDFFYSVPAAVDLTLAGHTHGGQLILPGIGPVSTSSKYKNKFAEGWVSDPVEGFVSRGLGVASVPLRFRCDAEIVVHEFQPA